MLNLYKNLFGLRTVPCIDADGTSARNPYPHGNSLRDVIKNGLDVTPIKLIHRASVHYDGRYASISKRMVNALIDLAHVFELSDDKSLHLRRDENFELAAGTSEVLAVGLATALMMRTLPCEIREIRRINGVGKRCDFEIRRSNDVTVFESKGRSVKNHIKGAVKDLSLKKQTHANTANYIYGFVSHLPRDGSPVAIHIYDPPGKSELKARTLEERNEAYLRHYSSVSRLAGLSVLGNFLEGHMMSLDANKPLKAIFPREFEREINRGTGRVNFISGAKPAEIWHSRSFPAIGEISEPKTFKKKPKEKVIHPAHSHELDVQFGLHPEVVNSLWKLDFDAIDKLKFEAFDDPEELISFDADGSLLKIASGSF